VPRTQQRRDTREARVALINELQQPPAQIRPIEMALNLQPPAQIRPIEMALNLDGVLDIKPVLGAVVLQRLTDDQVLRRQDIDGGSQIVNCPKSRRHRIVKRRVGEE
jgi:hypothetical protein